MKITALAQIIMSRGNVFPCQFSDLHVFTYIIIAYVFGFCIFKEFALQRGASSFYLQECLAPVLPSHQLKVIIIPEKQMDQGLKSRSKIIWKMAVFYNVEL